MSTPFPDVVDLTASTRPVTASFASGGNGQVYTGIGLLLGASWRETSGTAAAAFRVHDGTDASGQRILVMGIQTGAGDSFGATSPGIAFRQGLFVEVVSGACEVVLTWAPQTEPF